MELYTAFVSYPIHVLSVGDPADCEGAVERVLERDVDRFDVTSVTTEVAARESLSGSRPVDCLVVDDLPDTDGPALLDRLIGDWPELPVVSVVRDDSPEAVTVALDAGANEYLQWSPAVDQTEILARRIESVVDESRSPSARPTAEIRLDALFEQSPDMINVHDETGRIVACNPRLREQTGYDEAELTDMRVWDIDRTAERERARDLWANMAPGDQRRMEGVFERADGSTFPVEVHIRCIEVGEARQFVAISRDISELREREAELERKNDLFERAQEIGNVGTWEYDVSDESWWWSDEVYEICGLDHSITPTVDLVVGLVHPDDRDAAFDTAERSIRTGERFTTTFRLEVDDGVRWARVQGEPQTVDGWTVGVRGTVQDITDRVNREQELREKNERLDEFASIITHDLRNPLQVLRGSLDGAESTGEAIHFERGRRAIDRMESMISDVLALARQGERVDELDTVGLDEVVPACWESVLAEEATLEVDTEQRIRASETRLKQLVENLLRNAVEHGPADGTVRVGPLPDGFYVADDGPGIPPAEREQVFESGYSTAMDGTGFGLAIVEAVADAHGWSVAITESDTGGARFEFTGVAVV